MPVSVAVLGVMFLTAFADQPGEKKDKGPGKKGPPPDKKGWEPGKVIPPFVREALELTEAQQQKIDELEKDVRAKLLKILTEEQLQRAREIKGPKGPPKGDDGPPDKKGKGKKDEDNDDDEDMEVTSSKKKSQKNQKDEKKTKQVPFVQSSN